MSTTADRLLRKYSGDCCSHTDSDVPAQGARGTIALIGNPNVGKSVLFGALTGSYAEVSNYPGTTVGVMVGRFDDWRLVDTPGCYSIGAFSDDERVTRDVLLGAADVVVNVVDAVHLERDLFLTQHLIDASAPVVVALNMLEEAQKRGMYVPGPYAFPSCPCTRSAREAWKSSGRHCVARGRGTRCPTWSAFWPSRVCTTETVRRTGVP